MKRLTKNSSFPVFVRIVALFALTGLIFVLGDKTITGGSVFDVFGSSAGYVVIVLAVLVVVTFAYLVFRRV